MFYPISYQYLVLFRVPTLLSMAWEYLKQILEIFDYALQVSDGLS